MFNAVISVWLIAIFTSNSLCQQHDPYFTDHNHDAKNEMPRLAIIGGGIGGCATAYKLKQYFGSSLSVIDVYEANKIGGRLQTVTINGFEYETGGSIIHPANEHMVNLVKELGLSQLTESGGNFAMFDGATLVYETSRNSWVQTLELLWRYGLSLFTMGRSTNRFIKDFERIYDWQKEHQSFTTVPNLLMSMSDEVVNATQVTLWDHLTSLGVSDKLINELALAATRVNYAQSPSTVNAFVGSVSLAGAQPGLWSVKGGNHKVPETLLRESGATVINKFVTKVTNVTSDLAKPLYRLETKDGSVMDYDVVVLAFPLNKELEQVEFSGFNTDFSRLSREYVRLAVYIVEGVPNYKRFGYESFQDMPDTIFPVDSDSFYNSLSEIFPVSGEQTPDQRVYKVFANEKLSPQQLDALFSSRKRTDLVNWFAYPKYDTDTVFPQFVLAPSLYYINAIEMAASAMEMSTIGAVNIANLILHQLMGNDHLVDNMFVIEEKHIKIEL